MRLTSLPCVLALLLTTAAHAADFRGVRPGDSCDTLTAIELGRGSRALNTAEADSGIHLFVAMLSGHPATITYWCSDNRFFRGGYLYTDLPRAEGRAVYEQWRARLLKEAGHPAFDFASPEHQRTMQEFGMPTSDSDRRSAFWRTGDLDVHMSLYEIRGTGRWDVSVLYEAPH